MADDDLMAAIAAVECIYVSCSGNAQTLAGAAHDHLLKVDMLRDEQATTLARLTAELAALTAERDEARGLLVEAREVLALCTTRTFASPEDAEVRALGERIGFGALISSASKGWADVLRERHPEAVGGQHTAGPCEATVQRMLTQLDAYLEERK